MADRFVFSNFAAAVLEASVSPSTTVFQISSEAALRFPTLSGGGEKFPVVLVDSSGANQPEICYVTAIDGTGALAVERGQEGTFAQHWFAGTLVNHALTASTLVALAGLTPRGEWDNNTAYQARDVVTHEGIAYMAVTDNIASVPTPVSAIWQVFFNPVTGGGSGLVWQGRWNNATTYNVGDVIEFEGRLWTAASGNTNVEPGTTGAWTRLASSAVAAPFHYPLNAGGSTTAYQISISDPDARPTDYFDGMALLFRVNQTNTGPTATVAVQPLGAAPLRSPSGGGLGIGALQGGERYIYIYDSTQSGGAAFYPVMMPGVTKALTDLDARLDSAEGSIASLSPVVAGHTTAIGNLQTADVSLDSRLDAVEADLNPHPSGLKSRMTAVEATNAAQASAIATNTDNIAGIASNSGAIKGVRFSEQVALGNVGANSTIGGRNNAITQLKFTSGVLTQYSRATIQYLRWDGTWITAAVDPP